VPRPAARRLLVVLVVLALLGAACSDSRSGDTDGDTDGAAAVPTTPTGGTAEPIDPLDDPRGPVFDAFQQTVDRTGIYTSLDAICATGLRPPVEDDGRAPIVVAVMILLDDADPPRGDEGLGARAARLVDAFDGCGGIRGRALEAAEVVVDLRLRPGETADDVLRAACLEAVTEVGAAVVVDPVGLPDTFARCVAVEQGAVLLSAGSAPIELSVAAGGRLITLGPSLEAALSELVSVLARRFLLTGRTVGVITSEDRAVVVETALRTALGPVGSEVAVVAVLGCTGTWVCDDGVDLAVDVLAEADVDLLVPVLPAPELATVLATLADRGLTPQLQLTALDGLSSPTALRAVVDAGDGAARLFDGSLLVDWIRPGDPAGPPVVTVFDQRCTEAADAADLDPRSPAARRVLDLCALLRLAARGLEAATGGARPPVPDPGALAAATLSLGPIDVPGMLPATLDPLDPTATDVRQTLVVSWPCDEDDEHDVCLVESEGYALPGTPVG
jgi:hypothetical protein